MLDTAHKLRNPGGGGGSRNMDENGYGWLRGVSDFFVVTYFMDGALMNLCHKI